MKKERGYYSKDYSITKKGSKFNFQDSKYILEEREIIDILRDGRRSIHAIKEEVNERLSIERSWNFIEKLLIGLQKEELVDDIREDN